MKSYKSLINGIKNIFKPFHSITESASPTNLTTSPSSTSIAVRIPRFEHTLSRQYISRSALKVLYQLHGAGYQAFLVGGGVRDVLLGRSPKDFDVVTNARPEQIKTLFARNCHLIGRRFPLAHVHFGGEVIEVATFRASPDKDGKSVITQEGRILRDNVYGTTVDEDAIRRDFTMNALYYDIKDFSLLDYANGMSDLRNGIIRLIGDPVLRYREDPVRMLRAVRFAAKLNFTIAPETAQPITELANLLADVHTARLYEEVVKLFLSGYAFPAFQQLYQYGLFKQLFRQTENCFKDEPKAITLVQYLLQDIDKRVVEHAPVIPELLFATLLWPPLERLLSADRGEKDNEQEYFVKTMHLVIMRQNKQVAIPRRITLLVEEIWLLQSRLMQKRRIKKRCFSLFHHPYFQLGYDFLLLRAMVDDTLNETAQWWTQFVTSDDETRHALFNPPKSVRSRPKRRRRPKKVNDPDVTVT
jgi:poly(A) polymerase